MTEIETNQENITKLSEIQEKTIEISQESKPYIKTEENEANWRKFREEREKERLEKIEAQKIAASKQAEAEALKLAMEALLNKQQSPQQQNNNSYDDDETEEQRIDKRVKAALDAERKRYQEENLKNEQATFPIRLARDHQDFNSVVTTENLDYLEYHHPEIALGYKHMPDGYEKWSALYKVVKKYVPIQNKKVDEARINKNLQKPQAHSPNMTDTQPQTAGWKLTEERRKENWARMQRDRKSFGN